MQPYKKIKQMMSTGKVIKDYLVEEAISCYKEYSKFPVPVSARISLSSSPPQIVVQSEYTQRDLDRKEKVKFIRSHIFTHADGNYSLIHRTPPSEVHKELWNKASPSGRYRCIIRRLTNQKGEEKDYIEIWDKTHKVWNIDASAKELHGKIYEQDGQFGCLVWSSSEKRLAFIAEKKLPKATSFFDEKSNSKSPDDENKPSEAKARGDQNVHHEDWGELLVGKHRPTVVILNLDGNVPEISLLDCFSDDISPGQLSWAPDESGLMMAGWSHEPFRLGLYYCPIRKNQLYFVPTSGDDIKCFGGENRAVRSPRFSPDGNKVAYLDNEVGGPHYHCNRLLVIDWIKKSSNVVVDIVNTPKEDEFPGLYVFIEFPERCWASDSKRIVFSSIWKSQLAAIVVNTENNTVTRLNGPEKELQAMLVLDVHGDHIIALHSMPNKPHSLLIGTLPAAGEEADIKWTKLDPDVNLKLEGIKVELLKHQPLGDLINKKYPDLDVESIFLKPSDCADSKLPLVVIPHGGPHTAFMSDFSLYPAAMCACGFAVLLVNYRGSVGFGEDSIRSLLGNIGEQDVMDVQLAAESVLKKGCIDENQIAICGGSHGGFLTSHLIGQYPDFYKVAICRNPVTNLIPIFGSSDITDWAYGECGLDYKHGTVADMTALEAFWKRSPIRYIDQVITPTMIMVGTNDLRVPPHIGREYYKALKARNVPARFLSYAENSHPLNKVDTEADAFVNMVSWFWQHLC